uniref:Uncharacterized protein n=1 Tax=Cacopsylla melanoneura TaxID=428564 RepID=A0A8D8ZD17_9HEMI
MHFIWINIRLAVMRISYLSTQNSLRFCTHSMSSEYQGLIPRNSSTPVYSMSTRVSFLETPQLQSPDEYQGLIPRNSSTPVYSMSTRVSFLETPQHRSIR